MNPSEWRRCGYKTIFRVGVESLQVYLVNGRDIYYTDVNNGDWMEQDNLEKAPWKHATLKEISEEWLDEELREDIERTVRNCYCDKGVNTCDFCSGIRSSRWHKSA